MKKRSIGTILATALLAVGVVVGAQAFASEDTTNNISDYRSNAPQISEVAPFMREALPDLTEEQLEEWFNSRQNGARFGGMRKGMMRGAFGAGNAPEFSEMAPFMKEVFPDLTEEELEEWFNSRHSEDGFRGRGRGMMRGGFGFCDAVEFSEVAPFMREAFLDLTEEEIEAWFNSRFSEDGYRGRGRGMMRGGFNSDLQSRFDEDSDFQPGSSFGPRFGSRF